jgi:hypothetical protein
MPVTDADVDETDGRHLDAEDAAGEADADATTTD